MRLVLGGENTEKRLKRFRLWADGKNLFLGRGFIEEVLGRNRGRGCCPTMAVHSSEAQKK